MKQTALIVFSALFLASCAPVYLPLVPFVDLVADPPGKHVTMAIEAVKKEAGKVKEVVK